MGEYLAKNYIETKKRPIYIAREVIEYDEKIQKIKNFKIIIDISIHMLYNITVE